MPAPVATPQNQTINFYLVTAETTSTLQIGTFTTSHPDDTVWVDSEQTHMNLTIESNNGTGTGLGGLDLYFAPNVIVIDAVRWETPGQDDRWFSAFTTPPNTHDWAPMVAGVFPNESTDIFDAAAGGGTAFFSLDFVFWSGSPIVEPEPVPVLTFWGEPDNTFS